MIPSRYLVLCLLKDLMTERRVRVSDLEEALGLAKETISNLRNNSWKSIRRDTIEALCEYFQVTFDQLFIVIGRDIWFPCNTPPGRFVTIHLGTRVCATPSTRTNGEPAAAYQQEVVYELDHRAACQVSEHLYRTGSARVRIEGHSPEGSASGDRDLDEMLEEIFSAGVHIVVGSPVASALSERVVSRLYRVEPFTPSERSRFPYHFVYPSRTISSFGSHELGKEFGIYSTRTGRLVARRNRIPAGGQPEGQILEDCGLIVVKRLRLPMQDRKFSDDSRVVIALLGNGGLGTYGAAIAAIHPHHAAQLFPEKIGTVRAAVVRVPYERSLGSPRILAPELVEITDFHDGELESIALTPPPAEELPSDDAPTIEGMPSGDAAPSSRRKPKRKAAAASATTGSLRDASTSGTAIRSGTRTRKPRK